MTQPETGDARVVAGADEIARAVTRIAHQILEANRGAENLLLLGIPSRGVPLARRLAAVMAASEGREVPVGQLDITMYRDDLRRNPTRAVGRTAIPGGSVDGVNVVLVDDVLYSGRTVAAALDALKDLGRPATIKLAVLVDRGRREFPIQADVVGRTLPTGHDERVSVRLVETDGEDRVTVSKKDRP